MYHAVCSFIPSPSTIKLAITSTIISHFKNVETGKEVFEKIKTSSVRVKPPHRLVVYKAFIRRLKKKRSMRGFEKTFAIREYSIFEGSIKVYIDVLPDVKDKISLGLKKIRYIGSSDSLCYCLGEISEEEPEQEKVARPYDEKEVIKGENVILQLTDFTDEVTFNKINPYNKKEKPKLGKDIKLVPHILPLKIMKRGENYTIYELI